MSTGCVVTAASAENSLRVFRKNNTLLRPHLPRCAQKHALTEEKISVRCRVECRHMAVLGEMACALVNPIKTRHFYLAVKSTQRLELSFWHPGQLSLCPTLLKGTLVI